jgi:hypothetical protein
MWLTLKALPRIDEMLIFEASFDISASSNRETEVVQGSRDAVVASCQVALDVKCEVGERPVLDAVTASSPRATEAWLPMEQRRGADVADIKGLIPVSTTVSYRSSRDRPNLSYGKGPV